MRSLLIVFFAVVALLGPLGRLIEERWQATAPVTAKTAIAFVAGQTGPEGEGRREMLRAIELLLDELNAAGGVGGVRVRLKTYDDGNDPERARRIAEQIARDDSIVAVIGHNYSGASLAAAPVYAAAGVPAISPASTAVALTQEGGWYFRTIPSDAQQGEFLAHYARMALAAPAIVLVHSTDVYGRELAGHVRRGAAGIGLAVALQESLDPRAQDFGARIGQLAQAIERTPKDAVIVVLAHLGPAVEIVAGLREAGVRRRILGSEALGSMQFARAFASRPAEQANPGTYSDAVFVSVPFLADTANAEAKRLLARYGKAHGELHGWGAPYAYDAAKVLTAAMARAGFGPAVPADARRKLRDAIATMRSPESAVQGATGANYFTARGDPVKALAIGQFRERIISSLVQLDYAPDGPSQAPMHQTNVAYTGARIAVVRKIDAAARAAELELDLWFRFQGDIPVEDLVFANALDPVRLGEPQESLRHQGIEYRRFRVSGRFRMDFDGHPPDPGRHVVGIVLHHRTLSREELLLVPDRDEPSAHGPALAGQRSREGALPEDWRFVEVSSDTRPLELPALGNPKRSRTDGDMRRMAGYVLLAEIAPRAPSLRRWWTGEDAETAAWFLVLAMIALLLADARGPLARARRLNLALLGGVAVALMAVGEGALASIAARAGADWLLPRTVRAFDVLWWLVPAAFAIVALRRFVWEPVESAARRPVPRVVKTSVGILVVLVAVFGIVSNVLKQDVTGLLATSGLLMMIIGLALQSNIANVFSGIALNIERPFRPGDWVRIGDAPVGQVKDVSWRTTKIQTFNNSLISIPNGVVAAARVENCSFPNQRYFIFQVLHVDPQHDPGTVTELIYDALRLTESVDGRERLELMWVKFNGVDEFGAKFLVAFDVTDRLLMNSQEHAVLLNVHRTLKRAGVSLATRRTEMHVQRAAPDPGAAALRPAELFGATELFSGLAPEEREALAAAARRRVFGPGEIIIRQGEPGDSLFVLAEGVVAVSVTLPDGADKEVVRLGTGAFFGEMSLLTGEQRSATVRSVGRTALYEVTKADLTPLLEARPELAEALSISVTERQMRTRDKRDSTVRYEAEQESLRKRLLAGIMSYFKWRK